MTVVLFRYGASPLGKIEAKSADGDRMPLAPTRQTGLQAAMWEP